MDFHVGSIADLINQKTHSNVRTTKLFQNVSSEPVKEVQFKVISPERRKRILDNDEVTGFMKGDVDDDIFHQPKVKRVKQNNIANAARRLRVDQPKLKERIVEPEKDKRTIFVGNLPCHIKVTKLKKLFKSYGEIESARLRCPPVKDPRIPKRVAAIKKDFHPERTNIVGYVRFSSEAGATAALQANGLLYEGHHLRVDISSSNKTHNQKKAVFIGNVHFGTEENDLWKMFESCGEIDSIRIVRDPQTGVGKGFAYVNFKDLSSVELALKMDGHVLKERAMRVTRAVKKLKTKRRGLKVGKSGPGQKHKGVGKNKFAGKRQFRDGGNEVEERGEGSSQKIKRKPKLKQFRDSGNEVEERGEGSQKVKRKPKMKFKTKSEKSKLKLVKKSSEDGPSFLGKMIDDKSKGKIKKKKLTRAELKKQVLAIQLQLKKSVICD